MKAHWLTKLLSPESIAIVGASERYGSLAASTYQLLINSGYSGKLYSVNPKYHCLYQQACYSSLGALPVVPDLVIYALSGLAMEASFDEAMVIGVGGVVIYASNYVESDGNPNLVERLRQRAMKADIPVCGGNSMGFYNYDDNIMVSFDRPPSDRPTGHIGMILHSGSGMTYLANNDARFIYNYVIASAQEINASVADYIDFLLDQASTRVIAVLLETVRDVPKFIRALQKARRLDIPILITKLGRTEKSAQLALSHSGAIVGDHEAFIAACQRYGAILCSDMDEMIVTAMLFASGCRMASTNIASILDSGGMREQMLDLADDYGLSFAEIDDQTASRINQFLESGLHVDNPLDAMAALGRNSEQTFLESGKALLGDAQTGLLTIEFEFRDGFSHYPELFGVVNQLSAYNHKPVIVLNSCAYTSVNETAAQLTQQGIPVINGIDVALRAIKHLSRYSAVVEFTDSPAVAFDSEMLTRWKSHLASLQSLDEVTSLQLMAEFGLPVVTHRLAETMSQVIQAADEIGYPLAIKTAMPDIQHKSDLGGVMLSLQDQQSLQQAYKNLRENLGDQVVIMPMIDQSIELSLGMKNDPSYGPMLVIASGGILIELINDRVFCLAPVNRQQAEGLLRDLKINKLLDGYRGQPASNRQALIGLIVRFSEMIVAMSASIAEIDLNPVKVGTEDCIIIDALVVSRY